MTYVEQQKHEVKRGRCEGEGGEGKGVKRRWNGSNPVKRKSKRKQRKEKEEGLESKWNLEKMYCVVNEGREKGAVEDVEGEL